MKPECQTRKHQITGWILDNLTDNQVDSQTDDIAEADVQGSGWGSKFQGSNHHYCLPLRSVMIHSLSIENFPFHNVKSTVDIITPVYSA